MTEPSNNYMVTKASGEQVRFDGNKLIASLTRAGASDALAALILRAITMELYDGIATKIIYKQAFKLLQKHEKRSAVKYRLKQAVLELGPSGYPFEHFIGHLFKARGYEVQVGKLMKGMSVSHEVDVLAENKKNRFAVECKFHNRQGTKTDVKVPMYIRSRFEDLHRHWEQQNIAPDKNHQGWLITNTRFTEDAIKFGTDYNLILLSWDFPRESNLKDWIEIENLHPITCLSALTKAEKKLLLDDGKVLCSELYNDLNALFRLPIRPRNAKAAVRELHALME